MAVQTKTSSGNKPKKKDTNWMQIGVVAFCVLVAVMCILSFSGVITNIIGGSGGGTSQSIPAQPGYPVQVNATMYVGEHPIFSGAFAFYAGSQTNESLTFTNEDLKYPLIMYADEFNQISNGVIGLYPGQSTTVAGSGAELSYIYTKEQIDTGDIGVKFDDLKVGTELYLNETYKDELGEDATALRIGVVTQKTDEYVVIQYGSDTITIELIGYVQAQN